MRSVVKRLAQGLALGLAVPLWLLYGLLGRLGQGDAAFAACSQWLSLLPGVTGSYLRVGFYRLAMAGCDADLHIGFGTLFSQRDTRLEAGAYIGPQCNIGRCVIGRDTLVGSGVHIVSGKGQHRFDDPDRPIRDQGGEFRQVVIGADCWIGNGAIILADVGDGCIVGAGSVVTQALEPRAIVAGNPARVIGERR